MEGWLGVGVQHGDSAHIVLFFFVTGSLIPLTSHVHRWYFCLLVAVVVQCGEDKVVALGTF